MTDNVTELAKVFDKAAREADHYHAPILEGIRAVLAHLTTAGRLVPAGGMPLTAEDGYLAGRVMAALCTRNGYVGDPLGLVDALKFLESALFPATETAKEVKEPRRLAPVNDCCLYKTPECFTGHPAPAVPAEEETKAEGPCKFRKKPVEVEAMQYDGKDWRSIAQWMAVHGAPMGRTASGLLRIYTLEGEMNAHPGDWIIKGTQGEFYPCKPAPFSDTFAPASSPVVAAPTETGPWQRIEDVPDGVNRITDGDGDLWVKADGVWYTANNFFKVDSFAPFVAAEEKDA